MEIFTKAKYTSSYITTGKCLPFHDVNVRYLNTEGIWMALSLTYFAIALWGNIPPNKDTGLEHAKDHFTWRKISHMPRNDIWRQSSTVKHHKLPELIFCQRLKPICNATTFVRKHFVHLQTTKRTPGLQIYRTKKKIAQ